MGKWDEYTGGDYSRRVEEWRARQGSIHAPSSLQWRDEEQRRWYAGYAAYDRALETAQQANRVAARAAEVYELERWLRLDTRR